jgi:3-oxoacyl-[acyl-carrier-protein] synthase-3
MSTKSIISGVGHHLPPTIVSNAEIKSPASADPEGIRRRTGIETRHYSEPGVFTSDLATDAAKAALADAELDASDLDCIIAATLSPDYAFPGIGVYVQTKLGLNKIPAYDVRNQCSGFLYALNMARAFIAAGFYKKILLTCAEIQSHALGTTEKHSHMTPLFGDGAGAVVITAEERPSGGRMEVEYCRVYADGSGADRLRQRVWDTSIDPFMDWKQKVEEPDDMWCGEMDGKFIFRRAIAGMSTAAKTALKETGLELSDVDWVIPHQANLNISKTVGSVLKLPPEKMLNNIQRVGNTTAASIPILLSESIADGTIKSGNRVMTVAFGAGLTWGAALLKVL